MMAIKTIYDLTADIKKDAWYDITRPPGLAGEIAEDIAAGEVREQPRLRAVAALHELVIASKGKIKTPSGRKGTLLTTCIADSAGGKDRSQSHFKMIARDIDKGQHVFGRIASSKDIGRTLINHEGVATFIIDECHGLFGVMSQKNGATYMAELGSEILSIYSDRLKKFSDLDAINAKELLEKELKKLRAEVKDKGIVETEYRRREMQLEREILWPIQNGIEDPIFSMMCFSTPEKLASIICSENIGTGLIGRAIFIKGKDGRARKAKKFGHKTPPSLIEKMKQIEKSAPTVARYEDTMVEQLAESLDDRFEELRNDVALGAVISRSFEQVEKVATALSAGNKGVITEAMLMWAFCFVCESLTDVMSMLKVNESQEELGTMARWNEIKNRIENVLSGRTRDDSMPQSSIIQRVVKTKSLKGLAEAIARSNGEDFNFGAKTLITPVMQALMESRAIDAVGCGYWINDASKFESTKMSIKFSQIVEGIGMNMAAQRGWR